MPVIFIALGFTAYFFSLTILESIETKSFLIHSRKLTSSVTNDSIRSTVIAIYSSMGIALLPLGAKLLRLPNKTKLNYLLILTILFMGSTALISSIMLSNRSTFYLLIITFLLFTFYILYLYYLKNKISWIKCILSMSLLFIAIYLLLFHTDLTFLNQFKIPIFQRFAKNNLGDTRLDLWLTACEHLSTNFWGGKTYPLLVNKLTPPRLHLFESLMNSTGILNPNYYQMFYTRPQTYLFPFIHNLWLDIHYETGILPFFLIVTFHLAHLKSLLLLILNTKRQIIAITVLGIVTITSFYFMIEPVMTASYKFFIASCFLLAYFRQISKFSSK